MNLVTSDFPNAPGFYRTSPVAYHADPCPTPSLSSSVARVLLDASPRHAWTAHPRLNPAYEPDESRRLDLGTIAHAVLVGHARDIVKIEAEEYRTNAAKAARDDARAGGKTPVLVKDLQKAEVMVDAALAQLADIHGAGTFFDPQAGESEVTLVWQDPLGPWCRARIDWLPHEMTGRFLDYKTTSVAAPGGLGRRIVDQSYELQMAFYERGLTQLLPDLAGRVDPILVFQEIDPPYGLSCVRLDAEGREVGAKKAEEAIKLWARCLKENRWPGYPAAIVDVTYPTWALTTWNDREAADHFARQDGRDPFALLQGGAAGARLE